MKGLRAADVRRRALHYVTPPLYVAYWPLAAPKRGLRFADVPVLGYPRAMLNTSGVLVACTIVATLAVAIGRRSGAGANRLP